MNEDALKYINELYAPETDQIRAARERISKEDFSVHISPYEGKLLQTLIHIGRVKTCVEIGTLGGYSALWLAQALGSNNGHLYTCEHDDKRLKMAHTTLKDVKNVTIVEGDAAETLPELGRRLTKIDMVFIDADKKSYLTYLDWAERVLQPGGIIVADDTLLKGSVYKKDLPYRVRASTCNTLKEFNLRLADPKYYTSILLPTDAGLTIAVKK